MTSTPPSEALSLDPSPGAIGHRIRRAGRVAGAAGFLAALLALLLLSQGSLSQLGFWPPALTALALGGGVAWRLAGWAGPAVGRGGFLAALGIGPFSGAATLVAGTLGTVLGNAPAVLDLLVRGERCGELFPRYVHHPLVFGLGFGAVPALAIGLLCSLGLWTYLQCAFDDEDLRLGAAR